MFMITGCPLGATHYITEFVRRCGLDVGHERIRKDGIVDFSGVFPESKWFPFKQHEEKENQWMLPQKFDVILHQVRDPLKTINSQRFSTAWKQMAQMFTWAGLPYDPEAPLMTRAMQVWLYFNGRGSELADWTYQVEKIRIVFDEFCKRLGIELKIEKIGIHPKWDILEPMPERFIHVTGGKRGANYVDWTWDDLHEHDHLLCDEVIALARKYGYGI